MEQTFDLIFVTAGTLYMEENNKRYTVDERQFLILLPNRLHKGYKCCDKPTNFFWLHFYTTGSFSYAADMEKFMSFKSKKGGNIGLF